MFGDSFSFPLGIAPSATHRIAHTDGEIATAKGKKYEYYVTKIGTVHTQRHIEYEIFRLYVTS